MSFIQIPIGTYPNTFLGYKSSISMVPGIGTQGRLNTAFGESTLQNNTTGEQNTAVGYQTLIDNVIGISNTAVGHIALRYNKSDYNTAFGAAALPQNISGFGNTAIGYLSLGSTSASNLNTAIGRYSGRLITTGQKNTIIGCFDGNQGGLDIRTLNNYIVLSDGDGNPRLYIDGAGLVTAPGGFAGVGGGITLNNQTGAYTVVASDAGKAINCTANTFTVALTAAATLGSGFACFVWNTGTGVITIDPNGSETIDGVSTLTLRKGEGTQIVCNGTNWETGNKKTMRGYAENLPAGVVRPSAQGDQSVAILNSASANNTGCIAIGV